MKISVKKWSMLGPLCALTMVGCSSAPKHVDPSERDTTGTYDGLWVGEVSGPIAKQVYLPNNWVMNCEWDPYEIRLLVDDGRFQVGEDGPVLPVSEDGRFRIDVALGQGNMVGGIMPGNATDMDIYWGTLAGDEPRGKMVSLFESRVEACSANIIFRRDEENKS